MCEVQSELVYCVIFRMKINLANNTSKFHFNMCVNFHTLVKGMT